MSVLNLDTLTDLRTRAYLYRVLLVVGTFVAVPYGLLTEQEVSYWAMVASTVLGTGPATYNTPRPGKHAARP